MDYDIIRELRDINNNLYHISNVFKHIDKLLPPVPSTPEELNQQALYCQLILDRFFKDVPIKDIENDEKN